MELSVLLSHSEEELQHALEQNRQLDIAVADNARVLVQRSNSEGYMGDLRVAGNTVVLVREKEHHRFRQRLKEQIAIHVPRDQQPDLTEP